MGQFRNLSDNELDLFVGHPNPSTVKPDEVFTVDDEVDESYSNCPTLYGIVKSTFTPPPPVKEEDDVVVPGPLRGEEALQASVPKAPASPPVPPGARPPVSAAAPTEG